MPSPPALLSPGVRSMLYSSLWFSLGGVLLKTAGQDFPVFQIVLVRSAVGIIMTLGILGKEGVSPLGYNRKLLLIRGVVGCFVMWLIFNAVVLLPLGEATVLIHTNPIFTAILAVPFLGERPNKRVFLCIAAGIVGTIMVAKPGILFGAGTALSSLGVTLALTGAFCAAINFIILRKLGATENPLVAVFYLSWVTFIITLLPGLWVWQAPSPTGWALLLGVGLLTLMGQHMLTKAFKQEEAAKVSPVAYVQIVMAAIWGAIFFGTPPDVWFCLGALLIVSAMVHLGRKRHALPAEGDSHMEKRRA
jgi:drug/metabolite transporter (DMT)-like permease